MGKQKVWEQNKAWLEANFGKVTTQEIKPGRFQSSCDQSVQASDGDFVYAFTGPSGPTEARSIQNFFRRATQSNDHFILRKPCAGTPKRFKIAPKTHEKIPLGPLT